LEERKKDEGIKQWEEIERKVGFYS